jgi:hypothetical protein
MAKTLIAVFLVLIALGLACVFFLYLGAEAPPVSLSLSSPGKAYRVELSEHVDTYTHWAPIRLRLDSRRFDEVRFSAFKGNRVLAQNELLWDDTSGDSRFFESIKPRWINDSVLKFGGDESLPESKLDEVNVFNDTSQPVDHLLIKSSDFFLVLDLQPKTAVRLFPNPQSWLSWISCEGRFGSGKPIPFEGVNFFIRDDRDSHVSQHYCVSIGDNGVLIQSREVEGYRDEKEVKVTIAKGDHCTPAERSP